MEYCSANTLKDVIFPFTQEVFPPSRFDYIARQDSQAVQVSIRDANNEWFMLRFRDRKMDGPNWRSSPLCNWPNNHIDDVFEKGKAVERSTYWQHPDFPLTYPEKIATFIGNPFEALPHQSPTKRRLVHWVETWQEVTSDPKLLAPGSFATKGLNGITTKIVDSAHSLLKKGGVEYVTCVPTWLHILQGNIERGFRFSHPSDEKKVQELLTAMPSSIREDKVMSSWVAMLQFWAEMMEQQNLQPESLVDRELILRDQSGKIITYPLSPDRNLWLYKKL